jgi:hypothetical protein
MAVIVTCQCGKRFRAKDEHVGKRAKCPGCGNALVISGFPEKNTALPTPTDQVQATLRVVRKIYGPLMGVNLDVAVDGSRIGSLRKAKELVAPVPPGTHTLTCGGKLIGASCEFAASAGQKLAWEVTYSYPSLHISSVDPDAEPSSRAFWKQLLIALLASIGPIIVLILMAMRMLGKANLHP